MAGEKLTNIDDQQILKRAIYAKDKKALAQLCTKFYPRIRRHIISLTGSVADADDLAQDVFVELGKSDGRYDGQTDPASYLCGVANNIIHRHLRKNKPHGKIRYELIANLAAASAKQHDPSYEIQTEELKKTLEKALKKLPTKTRQAIKLRFIDGLTTKEAAEIAGCNVITLRQRISRGLKIIRLELNL